MTVDPYRLPADIAILCSGPSLTTTWEKADTDKYRLVLAINEAGKLPHDMFCCQDLVALTMFTPEPRIGYMGAFTLWKQRQPTVIWPSLHMPHHRYTLPQTIAGATLFKAQAIDIYGADWKGEHSFLGTYGPKRTSSYWDRLRGDVTKVVEKFRLEGRVRRIMPMGQVFC